LLALSTPRAGKDGDGQAIQEVENGPDLGLGAWRAGSYCETSVLYGR